MCLPSVFAPSVLEAPNAICAQFRWPILGLDTTDGGAGIIRGFPTGNLDATVTKEIRATERISATLIVATSANGLQARQMEFGLRIRF